MNAKRELEVVERQFWLNGESNPRAAHGVIMKALEARPQQPALLARALQIADRAELGPKVSERVETELKPEARRIREWLRLLDRLGDENLLPPEAVFDYLFPAVPDLDLEGLDPQMLESSRAKTGGRPQAAKALLSAVGWERLPEDIAQELRRLVDSLNKVAEEYQAHALLIRGEEGLLLGTQVYSRHGTGVEAMDNPSSEMRKQGHIALSRYADRRKVCWSLEWPLSFVGSSIGLALEVGGLVAYENLESDPLLAATGEVTDSGVVRSVDGIEVKLRAARDAGFQRVLLPEENKEDFDGLTIDGLPEPLYVRHVEQIRGLLAAAGAKSDFSLGGRVRHLRAALEAAGLEVVGDREIPHGRQLKVADAQSEATIQAYEKGNIVVQGPAEKSAHLLARQVVDRIRGSDSDRPRDSLKWKVASSARRDSLEKALQATGAQAQEAKGQSEQWRYLLQRPATKAQLTQWTTGTLMLQGEGDAFDEVLKVVERELTGLANISVEPKKSREPDLSSLPRDVPWAGTDESGKGDYFGPLVSAATLVDAPLGERLQEIGVQDSKKLTDSRVHKMAPEIRELLRGRYDITSINPAKFNTLYTQMKKEGKNMNTLLAWGHARSIEDLIEKGMRPNYVIVDKFADARYMEQKLLADTREAGIELVQVTKAEADIAVAAASILAREAFLNWLNRTSATLGFKLPKGAGSNVKEVARKIVATKGKESLGDYAKLFFKTTKEVLPT